MATLNSTVFRTRTKAIPSICTICGAPALYKYFGAISCHPCKIFFKRNAEHGLKSLRCEHNGKCEISVENRHACTSCRLAKCFASGMQIEMIRCSRQKVKQIKSVSNVKIKPTQNVQDEKKYFEINNSLKILRANADKLNIISYLMNSYEQNSLILNVQQIVNRKFSLPVKLRRKPALLDRPFRTIFIGIELFVKLNEHFGTANSYDRNIPLHTIENVANFGSLLVLNQVQSLNSLSNNRSSETIYGSIIIQLANEFLNILDRDMIFVKIGIAMFIYMIMNSASYTNCEIDLSMSIRDILRIHDVYTEFIWTFLISEYGYEEAVRVYMHLIRLLLVVNSEIIRSHEI